MGLKKLGRAWGDYVFIQKAIPVFGAFGVFGHITFYFILTHGPKYWESFTLRMLAAAAYATLLFFPRERALRLWHKIWFEGMAAATIPAFFTYMFFKNGGNVYWYASLVFAGLIYGLISKVYVFPWAYPLFAGIATWAFAVKHPDSKELIAGSLLAHLVTYFLGIITLGIRMAMEITHEKIMSARLALNKAEADLLRAEETRLAYEELKKREELISVFIRPSLVEEIRAGKDPSTFQPVIRDLAILFCDIRDFTSLTESLSAHERQAFLNQYFTMMTHPIIQNGGEVDKIMGDCVMGVFPDGDRAVRAAIEMRLQLQDFNGEMFRKGQPKIRNGIGIAKGEVMMGNFGSHEKLDRTVIGEAVNIAARLESKTKMYNLEIVVTEDVVRDLKPGMEHYRWIDNVQVKGSSRNLKLFEIYGHQPEEVRNYKDKTREMLEKALTIYFRKGFKDAQRLFHAMNEQVPPHRHVPNDLMDNILRYYLAHCDGWINNPDGNWDLIEKWGGVHVFNEK